MIRLPTPKLEDLQVEERSMRLIEYLLAFAAILAAVMLAFIR